MLFKQANAVPQFKWPRTVVSCARKQAKVIQFHRKCEWCQLHILLQEHSRRSEQYKAERPRPAKSRCRKTVSAFAKVEYRYSNERIKSPSPSGLNLEFLDALFPEAELRSGKREFASVMRARVFDAPSQTAVVLS